MGGFAVSIPSRGTIVSRSCVCNNLPTQPQRKYPKWCPNLSNRYNFEQEMPKRLDFWSRSGDGKFHASTTLVRDQGQKEHTPCRRRQTASTPMAMAMAMTMATRTSCCLIAMQSLRRRRRRRLAAALLLLILQVTGCRGGALGIPVVEEKTTKQEEEASKVLVSSLLHQQKLKDSRIHRGTEWKQTTTTRIRGQSSSSRKQERGQLEEVEYQSPLVQPLPLTQKDHEYSNNAHRRRVKKIKGTNVFVSPHKKMINSKGKSDSDRSRYFSSFLHPRGHYHFYDDYYYYVDDDSSSKGMGMMMMSSYYGDALDTFLYGGNRKSFKMKSDKSMKSMKTSRGNNGHNRYHNNRPGLKHRRWYNTKGKGKGKGKGFLIPPSVAPARPPSGWEEVVSTQVDTAIYDTNQQSLTPAVSMTRNGNIVAVGFPKLAAGGMGRVQVFFIDPTGDNTSLFQIGNDLVGFQAGDAFGAAVSINDMGNLLVVGAPYFAQGRGAAALYEYDATTNIWWERDVALGAERGSQLGTSVALAADAAVAVVGEPGFGGETGRVTIFDYDNNAQTWGTGTVLEFFFPTNTVTATAGVQGGDLCGSDVAVSNDGLVAAFGCPSSNLATGAVGVFRRDLVAPEAPSLWSPVEIFPMAHSSRSYCGSSVDLSSDGSVLAFGCPGVSTNHQSITGKIYFLSPDSNGTYRKSRPGIQGNEAFGQIGSSIALSADAKTIAFYASPFLSTSDDGSVSVQSFDGIEWQPLGGQIPTTQLPGFPASMDLPDSSLRLIVGSAPNEISCKKGIYDFPIASLAPTFPPPPTRQPLVQPTDVPTSPPTDIPTTSTTFSPTAKPSTLVQTTSPKPTRSPTTGIPTEAPTSTPTVSLSVPRTVTPSSSPSVALTSAPIAHPSAKPSSSPSLYPSTGPSTIPSGMPSSEPSFVPSFIPSSQPSARNPLPVDGVWTQVGQDLDGENGKSENGLSRLYHFLFHSSLQP